ncbi:MAG TPA: 16S rRNA (guanine(527)-N(7))-methyltransferase RsmG [Planctomycetaceae bacterium]|nr:16S rRNA (guanine(527)-N(7))-methyltransferase RsmG [Planctomycetaceae bacterium]
MDSNSDPQTDSATHARHSHEVADAPQTAPAWVASLNLQPPSQPSNTIAQATEQLGLQIEQDVLGAIEKYCQSLWGWNEKINLTRHTDYDTFVRRDLLDSYALAHQLGDDEEVLDIGTGGGVPGVLVAILRPDVQVSVCDSVAKKAKAVAAIVKEVGMNIPVHAIRAQLVLEDLRFTSLVSRAAGSVRQLLTWLEEHWLSFDRLLAIKGPRWVSERADARHRGLMHQIDLRKVISYPMPGTDSESVILEMKRTRN